MLFSNVRTYNFRNLCDAEVNTNAHDIFLVGENGQGKSNFLEAVYFCSYASSFRGSSDKEVICNEKSECSVQAFFEESINETVQINIIQDKKNITVDGKTTNDRKSLLSVAPSIVFCHEDMQFINGSPEQRRWFFDQNLCLYDVFYLDKLRKYKKILKTRNTILKELKDGIHNNYNLLDSINPQFVQVGLEIIQKRSSESFEFSNILKPLYSAVSEIENIGVIYHSSWKEKDELEILNNIEEKQEREIILGISLSGPHRDKYIFTQNGKDFSKKASTGQRRLLALLIRVAQAHRYHIMQNKKPVLLLDDVLLELDGEKRIRFLSLLPEYDQAFYTFLPEEPFSKYKKSDTIIYYMKDGHCRLEKN